MKARSALGTALVLVLVATGCSGTGSGDRTTRAAGAAAAEVVVTVRVGTDDVPGRPAAEQIQHFADRVAELSEGSIAVEPVWQAAGAANPRPDWDQQVARLAMSGELDGALVPARAWDTEGVDAFRPLHAPFLVDSHELLAQVLTSDLAERMMRGLDGSGVVALAILPEGLRHPFAFEDPLLGPADYEGAVLRVPSSATAEALFEAWGARTDDDQVDRAQHDGVESGFVLNPGGVATANVTPFPKANVLVLNEQTMDALAEADREILAQAAADTRTWALESFPTESALADEFCAAGGVVVHASEEDLGALQEAAAPVVADIRSSSVEAAEVIDAIAALKATVPPAQPAPPCGVQAETGASGEEAAVNGVYRMDVTADYMLSVWPDTPQSLIDNNVGTWTISLNDGRHYVHGAEFTDIVDGGTYRVEGSRVSFLWGDSTTPEVLEWSRGADGSLSFTAVNVPEQFMFVYGRPWMLLPELEPWDG
jgi:TRAP-type C4-dicarboxylate transport system substrate-binding protein